MHSRSHTWSPGAPFFRVNCGELPLTAVFHVCLGLPTPRLPSICISYAVLIAPLEHSTCPNQRSLLSLKMRSRSSSWSFASSLLDLTLATSSGLILQICLIMALSLRCKHCRFVLVSGQVSLAWHSACKSCTHGHGSCKRGGGMWELVVAPWTSSRQFSHELWLPFHSLHQQKACQYSNKCPPPYFDVKMVREVWWLSGRVFDFRSKRCWFETHGRHWVICVLGQDTLSSAYWFNPGRQEIVQTWLKNCWLGSKSSTRTKIWWFF